MRERTGGAKIFCDFRFKLECEFLMMRLTLVWRLSFDMLSHFNEEVYIPISFFKRANLIVFFKLFEELLVFVLFILSSPSIAVLFELS